jgi:hypothetical protein
MLMKKVALISMASSILVSATSAYAAEDKRQNKLSSWMGAHFGPYLHTLEQLGQKVEQTAQQKSGKVVEEGKNVVTDLNQVDQVKTIIMDPKTQRITIVAIKLGINPKMVLIEEIFRIMTGTSNQDPLLEAITMGIGSSRTSIDQIIGIMQQSDQTQVADQLGIDVTDKNPLQISESIIQKTLTDLANNFQIDTIGLSLD